MSDTKRLMLASGSGRSIGFNLSLSLWKLTTYPEEQRERRAIDKGRIGQEGVEESVT
jgi:hypothetical protein